MILFCLLFKRPRSLNAFPSRSAAIAIDLLLRLCPKHLAIVSVILTMLSLDMCDQTTLILNAMAAVSTAEVVR